MIAVPSAEYWQWCIELVWALNFNSTFSTSPECLLLHIIVHTDHSIIYAWSTLHMLATFKALHWSLANSSKIPCSIIIIIISCLYSYCIGQCVLLTKWTIAFLSSPWQSPLLAETLHWSQEGKQQIVQHPPNVAGLSICPCGLSEILVMVESLRRSAKDAMQIMLDNLYQEECSTHSSS